MIEPTAAIENLTNYQQQADMDGMLVTVFRQALEEVLDYLRTPPASQSDEALVEAINDYNSILRSCSQVAKRKGENTNWDALGKRITRALEKHHATWLKHWDGKIS